MWWIKLGTGKTKMNKIHFLSLRNLKTYWRGKEGIRYYNIEKNLCLIIHAVQWEHKGGQSAWRLGTGFWSK